MCNHNILFYYFFFLQRLILTYQVCCHVFFFTMSVNILVQSMSQTEFWVLRFRTVLHPSYPLCPCLVRRRVFLGCSNPTRSIAALPPVYCIFIVLRRRNMTDTRQLNPGFRTRTSQFALLSVFGSERTCLRWINSAGRLIVAMRTNQDVIRLQLWVKRPWMGALGTFSSTKQSGYVSP